MSLQARQQDRAPKGRCRDVFLAGLAGLAGLMAGCATGGPRFVADVGYDDGQDARAVYLRLGALRSQHGRGATAPFVLAHPFLLSAKERIAEGLEPDVALEHSLQNTADEGERNLVYWTVAADRLEDLRLPAELLQPRRLSVAVAVFRQQTGRRPRYLIVMATPSLNNFEGGE